MAKLSFGLMVVALLGMMVISHRKAGREVTKYKGTDANYEISDENYNANANDNYKAAVDKYEATADDNYKVNYD